jgi:hypothetical protein
MPRLKPKQAPTNVVAGYLLRYGSISLSYAFNVLKVGNLSSCIGHLRKRGHTIQKQGTGVDLKYVLLNQSGKPESHKFLPPAAAIEPTGLTQSVNITQHA